MQREKAGLAPRLLVFKRRSMLSHALALAVRSCSLPLRSFSLCYRALSAPPSKIRCQFDEPDRPKLQCATHPKDGVPRRVIADKAHPMATDDARENVAATSALRLEECERVLPKHDCRADERHPAPDMRRLSPSPKVLQQHERAVAPDERRAWRASESQNAQKREQTRVQLDSAVTVLSRVGHTQGAISTLVEVGGSGTPAATAARCITERASVTAERTKSNNKPSDLWKSAAPIDS